MLINGKHYETIWVHPQNSRVIQVIDQRKLPFKFEVFDMKTPEDVFFAIQDMVVRGAPLIGAAGAYGIYLASLAQHNPKTFKQELQKQADYLKSSRPTAINLSIAIDEVIRDLENAGSISDAVQIAFNTASSRLEKEREYCRKIGEFGLSLIEEIAKKKNGEPVNILTHCNAGWLACIDYGTATAPIYAAQKKGINVHVWVDETRPRNQGSKLTAWELSQQGLPNTIIADNTGGHLMQHGMVDMCIVGSDRTTRSGDVANKIGTYLKALAAQDNNVPFYVALPSSSFDFQLTDGIAEIPIELRSNREVTHIEGIVGEDVTEVRITNSDSKIANYGFDVTPSRLVSGLITERGICLADEKSIIKMFPDLI